MPESLQTFIWIFGVGFICTLLAIVAFFLVRLIKGADNFKVEVTASLKELSSTMMAIREKLGEDLNDLHVRVKVIEEAGCVAHRKQIKEERA
jgi:hypothetical protein